MELQKIIVFLSSPMGSKEWLQHRDAVIALFHHSVLGHWCNLTFIEQESGDPPQKIYEPMVNQAHMLVVLMGGPLPSGVKDELQLAAKAGKPILAFRRHELPFEPEDEQFVRNALHKWTTVQSYLSLDELLSKLQAAILGLIRRRLEERANTDSLAEFAAGQVARSLSELEIAPTQMPVDAQIQKTATTKPTSPTEAVQTLSVVCAANSMQAIAVPALEKAVSLNPKNQHLFRSLLALKLSSGQALLVEKSEVERLTAAPPQEKDDWRLVAGVALVYGLYSLLPEELLKEWSESDDDDLTALAEAIEVFSQISDERITPELVAEFHKEVDAVLDRLDSVSRIEGIHVFRDIAVNLRRRFRTVEVDAGFLPTVECCLNCMPRDSGEWVELSPARGSLEEITLESLYDELPGVEWSQYKLTALSATCEGCGSDLDAHDEVYEGWSEEPEEPEPEEPEEPAVP